MDLRKLPVPMESVLTRVEFVMVNMIVVIGPMRFAAQSQVSYLKKCELISKLFFLKMDVNQISSNVTMESAFSKLGCAILTTIA